MTTTSEYSDYSYQVLVVDDFDNITDYELVDTYDSFGASKRVDNGRSRRDTVTNSTGLGKQQESEIIFTQTETPETRYFINDVVLTEGKIYISYF